MPSQSRSRMGVAVVEELFVRFKSWEIDMALSLFQGEENVSHDFSSSLFRWYVNLLLLRETRGALNSLGIPPLSLRTIWFLEFSCESDWGRGWISPFGSKFRIRHFWEEQGFRGFSPDSLSNPKQPGPAILVQDAATPGIDVEVPLVPFRWPPLGYWIGVGDQIVCIEQPWGDCEAKQLIWIETMELTVVIFGIFASKVWECFE